MKKLLFCALALSFAFPVFANAQSFSNNLYYGLMGNTDVTALQQFLTAQGDYSGPISGNFYSLTMAGVKTFQVAEGLPQSGYFGSMSRTAANQILASGGGTSASVDWQQYGMVPSDFFKNPPAYVGTKVEVGGSVLDFLAAGDRGGTSNYIEILVGSNDPADNTQKIVLEIDNNSDYASAVSVLNKALASSNINSSGVIAYGTIEASQVFSSTNGGPIYIPVVKAARLDTCGLLICAVTPNATYTTQTIFPANTSSQASTATTPQPPNTSSSQQTFTTPSGAVIDQYGNVITPAPASQTQTGQSQAYADQSAAQNFYNSNHTCVGLTGNQYADCIDYAYNQTSQSAAAVNATQSATWHTVYTYSNNTSVQTPTFAMEGNQWRITYSCTASAISGSQFNGFIQTASDNGGQSFASFVTCPSTQTSYIYSQTPGQYYLNLIANTSYNVTVEDYY